MLQLDVPETLHEVLIKEENIFAEFGTFLSGSGFPPTFSLIDETSRGMITRG